MRIIMRLLGSMSLIVAINPENGPCVTCAWLSAWSWLDCVSLVWHNMLCLSHRAINASTILFGNTIGSAPRRTKRVTPRVLFTWRHGPWSGSIWTKRYPEKMDGFAAGISCPFVWWFPEGVRMCQNSDFQDCGRRFAPHLACTEQVTKGYHAFFQC